MTADGGNLIDPEVTRSKRAPQWGVAPTECADTRETLNGKAAFGLPGEFRVRYCRDGVTAAVTLYRTTKPLTKYPPLAVVRGFAKQASLSRPIPVETLKRPAQDRRPKPDGLQSAPVPAAGIRVCSVPPGQTGSLSEAAASSESLAALRSHAIRCPYGSPQTLPPAFGASALVAPTLSLCLPLRLPPPPPGGPGGGSGSLRSCRETESPLLLREDRLGLVEEPRADAPGSSPRFLTDAGATARNRRPRLPELHSSAPILRPFASQSEPDRTACASRTGTD